MRPSRLMPSLSAVWWRGGCGGGGDDVCHVAARSTRDPHALHPPRGMIYSLHCIAVRLRKHCPAAVCSMLSIQYESCDRQLCHVVAAKRQNFNDSSLPKEAPIVATLTCHLSLFTVVQSVFGSSKDYISVSSARW
jgi:hypothetical protein